MVFTNAQYVLHEVSQENEIRVTIDGLENIFIPISNENRYYREIMRQVEAGELTIQDAE